MSQYYTIKYTNNSLIPKIKTNKELYNKIFNLIYNNHDSLIFIGLISDQPFKYFDDLKRKLPFLKILAQKFDSQFEIPFYKEEIKAVNYILKEFNKDSCEFYKQIHPLFNFFFELKEIQNIIIVNVDDFHINIPLAYLKMKYNKFPNKIDLITEDSSEGDIEDIIENIELYYKVYEDELNTSKKDVLTYTFPTLEYDSKLYTFHNIKYAIDPIPQNGIFMPQKTGEKFLTALASLVFKYGNIIMINCESEIDYIITQKTGINHCYRYKFKDKVNILKNIYTKFKKDEFDEDTEDLKELLECKFNKNTFLI
tara:strand:- start:4154 stop:5083 length:930 start_codon:yes stop_codon:yes gene_type:complete